MNKPPREPEEFDVAFECSNAARIPFADFNLPLVHTLKPIGYFDAPDGRYYPTVWESHGKFVCGYQTDDAVCVAFPDWPVPDLPTALKVAERFTGLASEYAKGLR
jgi:hypothetical protein